MFKLRKLNSKGVAHHAILMLVVVMSIAGFGAYQVAKSNANNVYTQKMPNGCFPGKKPGPNGGCQLKTQLNQIKEDCTAYFLQFDGNQCVAHCIDGYHINDQGTCAKNNVPGGGGENGGGTGGGGSGGGGTGGGGGGSDGKPTEAECAALKRLNPDKTNNRCEECYAAFSDGTPNTYSDACVKRTITNPTTDGAGSGGSGGSSGSSNTGNGTQTTNVTTDNAAEITCVAQHKKWHPAKNICGPECATGYQLNATTKACDASATSASTGANNAGCTKVKTPDGNCVNENRIKAYCESRHLKLTDNGKNCKLDCTKGYTLSGTTCIEKGATEATQTANPAVLALDTTMDKDTCVALGRQWENRAILDDGTIGKGCATNKCDKNNVAIVNQANAAPYCAGYISKNDKSKCVNELHRLWVPAADGCMQNPKNKKPGAREANADQCQKKFSTYVWKAGADECLNPNIVDQLAGVAQATGKPFVALTNMTQAQVCNIQPHKHWNGKKCVQDKPAQSTHGSVNTPTSDPTPTGSLAPNGKSWDVYCASLGRNTAGHCGSCKASSNMLYGTDSYGWRRCVPKSSVCEQGGGTKICSAPSNPNNGTTTQPIGCGANQHAVQNTTTGQYTCVNNAPTTTTKNLGCDSYTASYSPSDRPGCARISSNIYNGEELIDGAGPVICKHVLRVYTMTAVSTKVGSTTYTAKICKV